MFFQPVDNFRDISPGESINIYFDSIIDIYYKICQINIKHKELKKIKKHLYSWCVTHYNIIKVEISNLQFYNAVEQELLTPRLFVSSIIHFFNAHELVYGQYLDCSIQIATLSKLGKYVVDNDLYIKRGDDSIINPTIKKAVQQDLEIIDKILIFLSLYGVNNNLLPSFPPNIRGYK
jgi:hypothetical protein